MVTTQRVDPGRVLFGGTRRRLLAWLFAHPDESYYFRELLRRTGTPEGGAQRELAALTSAGILTREKRGNQVYFQANRASPIFAELSSLLTKTTGIAVVVRKALAPLSERILVAFIYGSTARHELRHDSDVDLMIVGDVSFGDVIERLSPAQQTLGREINPTVYPPREFRDRLRKENHFLTAVLKTPLLFVLGDGYELERLAGAERLAAHPYDEQAGDRQPAGSRRSRSGRQPRRGSQR